MITNKRLLNAIKPHALERLYLINTLYEQNKISKKEYTAFLRLIYKSGGLHYGERYLQEMPYRPSNLLEYISVILSHQAGSHLSQ